MKSEINNDLFSSLTGIEPAEVKPFFYTRFRQRLHNKKESAWAFNLKPAFIVAMLSIFLLINSLVVYLQFTQQKNTTASVMQKNFAENYNLTTSSY
ncbi:hypothetical protein BH09BAC2_BH09BAC2_04770 [soil metagenome]